MYTIVVFRGGQHSEALLLSASRERLRIVMPGRADTSDFQLIGGRWISESGVHVEIEALIATDAAVAERVLTNARPCVQSAS